MIRAAGIGFTVPLALLAAGDALRMWGWTAAAALWGAGLVVLSHALYVRRFARRTLAGECERIYVRPTARQDREEALLVLATACQMQRPEERHIEALRDFVADDEERTLAMHILRGARVTSRERL